MIRYVSEKDVDFNSSTLTKKHRSQQKSLELKSKAVEVPEQGEKSAYALRILKKANDQGQMLKGRLSVLQIHQEKNDFKAFLNDQRYKFHQHMRDELERERQEKAAHLRKVMQKLNQTQQQARQERLQHQMNLKRAQEELYNSKVNDFKMTKERREDIERSINLYRQKEEQRKKQRNDEIREYERTQKSNVSQYFNSKKTEFYREDSKDSMKMSRVYQEKKKQIEELSKMESLMIERQARSKMTSEESENKLKGLLLPNKKAVSTSHTAKLPALNKGEKRTNSEQDMLLI